MEGCGKSLIMLGGKFKFKNTYHVCTYLCRVGAVRRGVVVLLVMIMRRWLGCGRRVEGNHGLGVHNLDVVGDALCVGIMFSLINCTVSH